MDVELDSEEPMAPPSTSSIMICCPRCGARYRVSSSFIGKRGTCKKCAAPFRFLLPEQTVAVVKPDTADEIYVLESQTEEVVPPVYLPGTGGLSPTSTGSLAEEEPAPTGRLADFLKDVLNSLLIFRSFGDLVSLTFLILILSLAYTLQLAFSYGFLIGFIALAVAAGWYMSFLLTVVKEAAAGERGLPNLNQGGWWEGVFLPLFQFLAAWIAARVLFVAGLIYLGIFKQISAGAAAEQLGRALAGDLTFAFNITAGGGAFLGGILILSMAFWPIMVLLVAIGGIRTLWRLDLMVITIGQSLPVYIVTTALVLLSINGVPLFTNWIGDQLPDMSGKSLWIRMIVYFATLAFWIYAQVFAMRVIGLYYHHYKRRFAWTWD